MGKGARSGIVEARKGYGGTSNGKNEHKRRERCGIVKVSRMERRGKRRTKSEYR